MIGGSPSSPPEFTGKKPYFNLSEKREFIGVKNDLSEFDIHIYSIPYFAKALTTYNYTYEPDQFLNNLLPYVNNSDNYCFCYDNPDDHKERYYNIASIEETVYQPKVLTDLLNSSLTVKKGDFINLNIYGFARIRKTKTEYQNISLKCIAKNNYRSSQYPDYSIVSGIYYHNATDTTYISDSKYFTFSPPIFQLIKHQTIDTLNKTSHDWDNITNDSYTYNTYISTYPAVNEIGKINAEYHNYSSSGNYPWTEYSYYSSSNSSCPIAQYGYLRSKTDYFTGGGTTYYSYCQNDRSAFLNLSNKPSCFQDMFKLTNIFEETGPYIDFIPSISSQLNVTKTNRFTFKPLSVVHLVDKMNDLGEIEQIQLENCAVYDNAGKPILESDANYNTKINEYDAWDRLTRIILPFDLNSMFCKVDKRKMQANGFWQYTDMSSLLNQPLNIVDITKRQSSGEVMAIGGANERKGVIITFKNDIGLISNFNDIKLHIPQLDYQLQNGSLVEIFLAHQTYNAVYNWNEWHDIGFVELIVDDKKSYSRVNNDELVITFSHGFYDPNEPYQRFKDNVIEALNYSYTNNRPVYVEIALMTTNNTFMNFSVSPGSACNPYIEIQGNFGDPDKVKYDGFTIANSYKHISLYAEQPPIWNYSNQNIKTSQNVRIDNSNVNRYYTKNYIMGRNGQLLSTDKNDNLNNYSTKNLMSYDGLGQMLSLKEKLPGSTETILNNFSSDKGIENKITDFTNDGSQIIEESVYFNAYSSTPSINDGYPLRGNTVDYLVNNRLVNFYGCGKLVKKKNILLDHKPNSYSEQYFDSFDRLVADIKYNDVNSLLYDATYYNNNASITTYNYDAMNRVINITDPENFTTKYTYDNYSNIIKKIHPTLGEMRYKYDNAANTLRFSQDAKQIQEKKFSFYEYDNLKRITLVGEACFNNYSFQTSIYSLVTDHIRNDGFTTVTDDYYCNKRLFENPIPAIPEGNYTSDYTCYLQYGAIDPVVVNPIKKYLTSPNQSKYMIYSPSYEYSFLDYTLSELEQIPQLSLNNFENVSRYPSFVRVAYFYDDFPLRKGAVWGQIPEIEKWVSFSPKNGLRNTMERVTAIAYRDMPNQAFNYIVYSYDERGRIEAMLRFTDNIGFDAVYYKYNSENNVTSVRVLDPLHNNQTWYDYDSFGRLEKASTAYDNTPNDMEYWGLNAKHSNGVEATFAAVIPPALTKPETPDVKYDYNTSDLLIAKTYPIGNQNSFVTHYTYNQMKHLTEINTVEAIDNFDWNDNFFKETYSFACDAYPMITQKVSKQLNFQSSDIFEYNLKGELTKWKYYNSAQQILGNNTNFDIDRTYFTEMYRYDKIGNRIRTDSCFNFLFLDNYPCSYSNKHTTYTYDNTKKINQVANVTDYIFECVNPGIYSQIASCDKKQKHDYLNNGALANRIKCNAYLPLGSSPYAIRDDEQFNYNMFGNTINYKTIRHNINQKEFEDWTLDPDPAPDQDGTLNGSEWLYRYNPMNEREQKRAISMFDVNVEVAASLWYW